MCRRGMLLGAVVALVFAGAAPASAAMKPITQASPEQLAKWLKQYPRADADKDGQLTVEEAERYRQKLARDEARRAEQDGQSFRREFTFATMSDGVKIALAVAYPPGFDPKDTTRRWPAMFSTCGYTGATVPMHPDRFGNRCVTVNVSLRGTGASGGQINPWCERTWRDGYEVIENWIVKQPWSNGRVGVIGHSWPGLMGFCTASTNPPSVKAVCVSGLFDDCYRSICRIGGVRNCGFPEDWLNSYYRMGGPFGSGESAMEARGLDESAYGKIVASRGRRDLFQDMLWLSLHEHFDGPAWQGKSLAERARLIKVPILLGHQYQDEQTGPSGCWLFSQIPDQTPKRMVLSNGPHQTPPVLQENIGAWLAHFLLEEGDASIASKKQRVQCHFETCWEGSHGSVVTNPPLIASEFPLPGTRWTRLHLRTGRQLTEETPGGDEPSDAYRVDRGHPLGDREMVYYAMSIDEPLAICGPIVVTLWAELSTIDADFFVLLGDLAPDGTLYGLQRGLLRASHRRLDEERSTYVEKDGQRLLVRPRHTHAKIEPVRPREACEYQIEVFPVGHVFRPGHKLVLRIGRPPFGDPVGVAKRGGPSYRYDSDAPPGTVRILHGAEHPSSILLPVLPKLPPVAEDAPEMREIYGLKPVEHQP